MNKKNSILHCKCILCNLSQPCTEFYGISKYCKTCEKQKQVAWQKSNPDKKSAAAKRWYRKHKKRHIKNNNKWKAQKIKTDISFRILNNLRQRTHSAFKGRIKNNSVIKELGCSKEELRSHIESQFQPGMTWENYGSKVDQWCIDHIFPLSKVDMTNAYDFKKVCHYSNLRPLWVTENAKKGSKIINLG